MKVASFETAKLLKREGYLQESYFAWVKYDEFFKDYSLRLSSDYDNVTVPESFDRLAAPTADEIIGKLSDRIQKDNLSYGFRLWLVDHMPHVRHYCCNYFVLDHGKEGKLIMDDFIVEQSLVEAVAKMWLYLKKNNFI